LISEIQCNKYHMHIRNIFENIHREIEFDSNEENKRECENN